MYTKLQSRTFDFEFLLNFQTSSLKIWKSVRRIRYLQRMRIIFRKLQWMTTRHMHTKLQMNRFIFDGDIEILKSFHVKEWAFCDFHEFSLTLTFDLESLKVVHLYSSGG
jgi:hypothetical protein